MSVQYFAADYAYGINPQVEGLIVQYGSNAAGVTGIVNFNKSGVPLSFGRNVDPIFNTNATVNIDGDFGVTVSAVSTLYPGQPTSITLTTPTHAHGKGSIVSSGTVGLQEAINDAAARTNGGTVIVDSYWTFLGGTSAMLAAATLPAGVVLSDIRTSSNANGQYVTPFHNTELITLVTTGLTTDSTANLLPANSIILMVTGYVTTTITTSTDWKLGDPTTAARFTIANTALTAGSKSPTTSIPPVMIGTGVANATTGMWQLAAAKVRISVTGANAGAGAIRVDTYGYTFNFPSS